MFIPSAGKKARVLPPVDEIGLARFWRGLDAPDAPLTVLDTLSHYYKKVILRGVPSSFKPLLGYSYWETHPSGDSYSLIAGFGSHVADPRYPRTIRLGRGAMGRLIGLEAVGILPCIVLHDLDKTSGVIDHSTKDALRHVGIRSLVAIPVVQHGIVSGVFKLYSPLPIMKAVNPSNRRFRVEQMRLARLLHRVASHRLLAQTELVHEAVMTFDVSRWTRAEARDANLRDSLWLLLEQAVTSTGAEGGRLTVEDPPLSLSIGSADVDQAQEWQQRFGTDNHKGDLTLLLPSALPGYSAIDRYSVTFLLDMIKTRLQDYRRAGDVTVQHRMSAYRDAQRGIARGILEATSADDAIALLLRELALQFHLPYVVYLAADGNTLIPGRSEPASIAEQLEASGEAVAVRSECPKGDDWQFEDCYACQLCEGLTSIAALRRATISESDVTLAKRAGIYREFGTPEAVGETIIPLEVGEHLFGVVDIYQKEGSLLETYQVHLIQTLATTAALALYNRELLERRQQLIEFATRGEMAIEVVHTVDPLLTVVKAEAERLLPLLNRMRQNAADRVVVQDLATKAMTSAQRLSDLNREKANVLQPYRATVRLGTKPKPTAVRVDQIVRELFLLNEWNATKKRVTLGLRPEGTPRTLRLVEPDVYLVFWNLIHNAIKFTRGNRPTRVTVYVDFRSDPLVVRVVDGGVGIRQEDLSRIWNNDYSTPAPGANTRTTGLGLWTVKNLLKDMDADIQVRSEFNKGSEFEVRFFNAK